MPSAPPLIGTYAAPAVKRGERVSCLYRDTDCKVTSLTDAPIPWPRAQAVGHRGGCGLRVNAELRRAIRTESAESLKHWFGVSALTAWKWWKAFGVGGRVKTLGSGRAIRSAAKKGATAMKVKEWSEAERSAKAATSKRLGSRPGAKWTPERGGWTAE